MIVANCYRFAGHFSGDTMKYRTEAEAESWLERDPLRILHENLVREGALTESELSEIVDTAEELVEDAVTWAESQPLPTPDQAAEDLYA